MQRKTLLTTLLILALPLSAQAHRVWLLPAATVLSGDAPWVTFDAAVSNDVFYFNHHPLQPAAFTATAPDGSEIPLQNPHAGKHRGTFDLQLLQTGTYRVSMASSGLRARWEDENGERHFWPGRGETPAPGDFERKVPSDAKNLEVSHASRRVETWVTAGAPTDSALAPTGEGLEMQAHTHPNDLYSGETASFQFLIDGQPAAGTEVTLIPDGVRYRDSQEEMTFTANAEGFIAVTWPQAGRYWLEAEYQDDRAAAPATIRQGSYVVTLEVLPL
ncbi:MAG: ABC transporter permease [Haliea sp.]|nr:ABC transporter permease [Haliea sp.]